jgi:glycosyltransferase involved in cell wall biosynthesis
MDRSDAPLVTLVLFAYNQEKFIRQAMEGAFAQTYQPLEIIVSDDSSPDGTFAIMSEWQRPIRGLTG